jgi:hypothetical protein
MADTSKDASTRASPAVLAPPPWPPVTSPTPASATANPAHATGRATARCHTAAITATITGTEPISRAAWVTLVRVIPAFCSRTEPPYPSPPETSTAGRNAARSWWRASGRRITAATAKRTNVSQPGGSQCRASLDSGTVVPQSSPAPISAAKIRRFVFMRP